MFTSDLGLRYVEVSSVLNPKLQSVLNVILKNPTLDPVFGLHVVRQSLGLVVNVIVDSPLFGLGVGGLLAQLAN